MKVARFALVLAMLGGSTLAAEKKAPKSGEKPTFHAEKSSTVTATVKSVDQKTRMVTLANTDGEITFKAGPEVKNLPQLKDGDIVTVMMTESVSAHVLKKGESVPYASERNSSASAPVGQKPAGYKEKQVYVVATVAAIDKENMVVTLKTPQGETYPIKAQKKENLAKLAVGDDIAISAIKAVAVQVTSPETPDKK
jgi:hypothetical protein